MANFRDITRLWGAGLVFVVSRRMEVLVRAKSQGAGFGACDDKVEIELRHLLWRVVIYVVEVPTKEYIGGLDQVIDRYIHWHWTGAPRLPAFDNDLYRFRLQDFADRVRLWKRDINSEPILMLLDELE